MTAPRRCTSGHFDCTLPPITTPDQLERGDVLDVLTGRYPDGIRVEGFDEWHGRVIVAHVDGGRGHTVDVTDVCECAIRRDVPLNRRPIAPDLQGVLDFGSVT